MSGEHIQISVTHEQTNELLASLARLWIANYETKTIALDEDEAAQLMRCEKLIQSWSQVFQCRAELRLAEAAVNRG